MGQYYHAARVPLREDRVPGIGRPSSDAMGFRGGEPFRAQLPTRPALGGYGMEIAINDPVAFD